MAAAAWTIAAAPKRSARSAGIFRMAILPPLRILVLALAVLALPMAAVAFKEGPYPNVTGGFGEQTCHTCHLDNPINAAGGQLQIDGIPRAYVAGQPYRITIALARDRLERAGFEIAARFAAGKQKGKQAGTWRPVDQRVQLIPGAVDKSLIFVQHNLAGSRAAAAGSNQWTIEWEAPAAAAGPVQFNVAANASNNDDSPLGDFVYVKTVRSA